MKITYLFLIQVHSQYTYLFSFCPYLPIIYLYIQYSLLFIHGIQTCNILEAIFASHCILYMCDKFLKNDNIYYSLLK